MLTEDTWMPLPFGQSLVCASCCYFFNGWPFKNIWRIQCTLTDCWLLLPWQLCMEWFVRNLLHCINWAASSWSLFSAKSARQNRGYDQEELREEPAKPNLDQKHGWQAKRSLDNELYRNVELEVWEDSKNGNWSYFMRCSIFLWDAVLVFFDCCVLCACS